MEDRLLHAFYSELSENVVSKYPAPLHPAVLEPPFCLGNPELFNFF
jgi:hypothetical protein